jgi:hypothetical protein
MIVCPKCNATLPPKSVRCQFCGTDVSKVERPAEVKVHRGYDAPPWVWTWYTIVCIYWMLDGVFQIAVGAGVFSDRTSFIDIIIGALLVVIGLGMLFRVRFLRGVAHFLCWVALIFGVIGIGAMLTVGTLAMGPIAWVFVVFLVLRVALSAFMIYLIGETESHYPM